MKIFFFLLTLLAAVIPAMKTNISFIPQAGDLGTLAEVITFFLVFSIGWLGNELAICTLIAGIAFAKKDAHIYSRANESQKGFYALVVGASIFIAAVPWYCVVLFFKYFTY